MLTPALFYLHFIRQKKTEENNLALIICINAIPYNFGGQNFWRTRFFGGQNFRHQVEILAVLSDEIFFIAFLFPHTIHKKNMFWHDISINLTCFRFQRTEYFGGQNFRRTKPFGGQNFRQQVRFLAVLSTDKVIQFLLNHISTLFLWFYLNDLHEGCIHLNKG